MVTFKGVAGDPADIGARNLWFGIEPDDDRIADAFRGRFGDAFWAANTETGGDNAGMEFVALKGFTWSPARSLDDVDSFHDVYMPPIDTTFIVRTWLTYR